MIETRLTTPQTAIASVEPALQANYAPMLLPAHKTSLLEHGETRKVLPDFREAEKIEKRLPVTKSDEDPSNVDLQLHRLKLLRETLNAATDLKMLRERTKERRDLAAKVFAGNMQTIFREQRPMEKTYRELEAFYNEARLSPDDTNLNVSIINASFKNNYNELMDAETGLPGHVPKRSRLDLEGMIGLIVVPEWLETEGRIVKLGEVAQEGMAHAFIGFKDCALEEAWQMFEPGEDLANLKSMDRPKQYVSLVGNHLRIRKNNRYENGADDGLYISPAMILAGKVYKGDIVEGIHVAQANDSHKVTCVTPDNSELKMRWPIMQKDDFRTLNRKLIPLSYRKGIVFWGVETLYDARGNSEEMQWEQYTVKRCDEYISKVILDFLQSSTFKPNELKLRDTIRDLLQKFLNKNVGGPEKMLQKGVVVKVEPVPGKEDELNIQLDLKYKLAIRHLNLHMRYDTGTGLWSEAQKEETHR